MNLVIATVAYGRSGGTESVARDLCWGLLRKGYDFTILTETCVGDPAPVKVTKDMGILQTADMVIQVGVFSMMDWEVTERRRRKMFPSSMLIWVIEPEAKFFQWVTDPNEGVPQDKVIFGYSSQRTKIMMDSVGLGHLGMKIRYGVPTEIGRPGFKKKRGITTPRMFLTCGGFDERKRQHELVKTFLDVKPSDTTLVVTGHRLFTNAPKEVKGIRVIVPDDRQEVVDAVFEADLYIQNSDAEGFGLVLLESMFSKTRWASNKVGAAIHREDLADYGYVYENEEGLKRAFREYERLDVMKAYQFAMANHRIDCMVDDVEVAMKTLMERAGK